MGTPNKPEVSNLVSNIIIIISLFTFALRTTWAKLLSQGLGFVWFFAVSGWFLETWRRFLPKSLSQEEVGYFPIPLQWLWGCCLLLCSSPFVHCLSDCNPFLLWLLRAQYPYDDTWSQVVRLWIRLSSPCWPVLLIVGKRVAIIRGQWVFPEPFACYFVIDWIFGFSCWAAVLLLSVS